MKSKTQWITDKIKNNKGFLIFILLMLVFRSAVADWNYIPSGSMKPTLEIGDRVIINKLAYNVKVPFINKNLFTLDSPKRSDIVVFESSVSNKRLIKRVVGIAGDTVSMKNNRLYINNQPLNYEMTNEDQSILTEFNEKQYQIMAEPLFTRQDNFPSVIVPQNHLLVLGDNRNNSSDSRVIGFVPIDEVLGKATSVAMSHNHDNYFLPKPDRFNIKL